MAASVTPLKKVGNNEVADEQSARQLLDALEVALFSSGAVWNGRFKSELVKRLDRMSEKLKDKKLADEMTCKEHASPCPNCAGTKVSMSYLGLTKSSSQAVKCFDCGELGPVRQNQSDAVHAWNALPKKT